MSDYKPTKKEIKERDDWKKLLERTDYIIPLGNLRKTSDEAKKLELYNQYEINKILKRNQFVMIILTALIVLLTAVNIWLTFYKQL